MKSFIVTKRNSNGVERRFHIEANNIREAAAKAESMADSLWIVIKIEVLE